MGRGSFEHDLDLLMAIERSPLEDVLALPLTERLVFVDGQAADWIAIYRDRELLFQGHPYDLDIHTLLGILEVRYDLLDHDADWFARAGYQMPKQTTDVQLASGEKTVVHPSTYYVIHDEADCMGIYRGNTLIYDGPTRFTVEDIYPALFPQSPIHVVIPADPDWFHTQRSFPDHLDDLPVQPR